MSETRLDPTGHSGAPQLEELQRGTEDPPTVETLEEAPPTYGERGSREIPIPHPAERPGAIDLEEDAPAEP
jgi:hypothetical protein